MPFYFVKKDVSITTDFNLMKMCAVLKHDLAQRLEVYCRNQENNESIPEDPRKNPTSPAFENPFSGTSDLSLHYKIGGVDMGLVCEHEDDINKLKSDQEVEFFFP